MKKIVLALMLAWMTAFVPASPLVVAQGLPTNRIIGDQSIIEGEEGKYGVRDLGDNSSATDQKGFKSIAEKVGEYVKRFMLIIGILIMIYAGIELFFSRGKEEVFKEKIQQTIYLGLGYTVMLLASNVVYDLFFGEDGEIFFDGGKEKAYEGFAQETFREISGLFDYVTMFAIALLLMLVLVTIFQFILAAETDDAKDRLQRQLLWGSIGILVLNGANRIVGFFFDIKDGTVSTDGVKLPEIDSAGANTVLGEIIGWANFMLGYVAFLAVVAIIVAGGFMIVHFGDEDKINKAKSILISCVIALVVCFSSWAAINFLLFPVPVTP